MQINETSDKENSEQNVRAQAIALHGHGGDSNNNEHIMRLEKLYGDSTPTKHTSDSQSVVASPTPSPAQVEFHVCESPTPKDYTPQRLPSPPIPVDIEVSNESRSSIIYCEKSDNDTYVKNILQRDKTRSAISTYISIILSFNNSHLNLLAAQLYFQFMFSFISDRYKVRVYFQEFLEIFPIAYQD